MRRPKTGYVVVVTDPFVAVATARLRYDSCDVRTRTTHFTWMPGSVTGVPALIYQDFVLFQLIFETPEPVKLALAVDGERLVSSAFLIFGGADDSW
jgi:hypothetical protein